MSHGSWPLKKKMFNRECLEVARGDKFSEVINCFFRKSLNVFFFF